MMAFQIGYRQVCNTLFKVYLFLAVSFAFIHCQTDAIEIDEREVGDWSEWSPWGKYGSCSSKCGVGYTYKTRSRKCLVPPCPGSVLDIELNTCYSDECPGSNQHSSLAQWSPCLPDCGDGVKVRAKSTSDRRLVWEAIQCKSKCPEKRRQKRWFGSSLGGSASSSVSSSGSRTHSVTVNTPIGSFSGSITTGSRGKISGGSIGVSRNFGIANVGASLGYSKSKGVSVGVKGGVKAGGYGASGGATYHFGDKSTTFSGSASGNGRTYGISHNTKSGTSISYGRTYGRREVKIPSEVDEFCKKIGDGMFIYPGDCQRYVDCEKGVAYIAKCLEGKAWDNDVKRCEPAEEVGCKNEF